jgi:hypothetical protein
MTSCDDMIDDPPCPVATCPYIQVALIDRTVPRFSRIPTVALIYLPPSFSLRLYTTDATPVPVGFAVAPDSGRYYMRLMAFR